MSGNGQDMGSTAKTPASGQGAAGKAGAGGISALRPLVGDLRQLASLRRVELLDGPERGLEAVEVRAGLLSMTVLAGRALDIGELRWGGLPVGWVSPAGFTHPGHLSVESDLGRGFERGFSGFLTTCGLTHKGQPRDGWPLHGHLPFLPARLTASQEDFAAGKLVIEGQVRQWRLNHENLVLTRRIEVDMDGSGFVLEDRLYNDARVPVHPQLLYHVNFGWPAIGATSRLSLNGKALIDGPVLPDPGGAAPSEIFPAGPGARAEALLETGSFRATLGFDTGSLPFLQIWRDLAPGTGVFSVEPASSLKDGPHPVLNPGESRLYRIRFGFSGALALPPG